MIKKKNIIIIDHALKRSLERGTSENEIKQVLEKGKKVPAKEYKKAKELVLKFNKKRHGKYYSQKKIKVIYVKENNKFIVITIYVYFGKWR